MSSSSSSDTAHHREPARGATEIDVREHGAPRDGVPQVLERRLYMQLLVYEADTVGGASDAARALGESLSAQGMASVLYADVNNPAGLGLLSWTEEPKDFVEKLRPALANPRAASLRLRPDFTMLGRTYSSGFEPDLEYWLLRRPRETALDARWPWAVWYPLRRSGAFERLEGRERGGILKEHAEIGKAYGAADLAHDIRLACHGLDAKDNEFVIGLIGKDLHPLSHVVQAMRRTRQTAEFINQMGPFFVGHVVWRHGGA
jgi:chlorite dismutase